MKLDIVGAMKCVMSKKQQNVINIKQLIDITE